MRVLSLFFLLIIVVVCSISTFATSSPFAENKEQQMEIDAVAEKLTTKVQNVNPSHIDQLTPLRLPELPRYDGAEDGFDLQFCKTGKDDAVVVDDRNRIERLSGNSYVRAPLTPLCGRYVIDNFLSEEEADALQEFAEFGMAIGGGGAGGVTLVDFVGSIVSHGTKFANLTILSNRHQKQVLKQRKSGLDHLQDLKDLIPTNGMLIWLKTIHKIHRLVEKLYDTNTTCPNGQRLRYAMPAFFSRIDPMPARSPNDEYWHTHIDTEQYGSFDVTTLLYLSNEREELNRDEFADFIAGSAKGKLAKNRRPETKEEMKTRIAAKDKDPRNADVFHLGDAPDEMEDEEVRRNANSNFQGGSFEFLGTRKDGKQEGDQEVSSEEFALDAENPEVCHIGENAEESIAQIKKLGKTCKRKLVVHPKKGRLTIFTSGPEHPHRVRKVAEGVRWTSTNAFTCDREGKSIDVMNREEFPASWLSELAARAVLEN